MKKIMIALLLMAAVKQVSAQTALKVGDMAPSFAATDNYGKAISLKELLKKNKYVVLFFYRGQWCPYCNKHISQLQDSLQTLTSKGAYVLGVTPETSEALAKTVGKTKASFSMISDKGYKIMKDYQVDFVMDAGTVAKYKQYGIDLEANNGNADHVLPVPATYVIGRSGKIIYAHFDQDYKRRASVSQIASILK